MSDRPAKRPRLEGDASDVRFKRSAFLSSLTRKVSPPRSAVSVSSSDEPKIQSHDTSNIPSPRKIENSMPTSSSDTKPRVMPSPIKLTKVTGLPSKDNIDTISLHDILGDPLIKQAWIFNYCFDVDYTMKHFDADVRQLVDVKLIHGSWKNEDGNRKGIEGALSRWKNVKDIKAYLPDQFGTHHSKMIILFKHDDTAQVVIHTANMLEQDWEHMTNAAWLSPVLQKSASTDTGDADAETGTGSRFKADLVRYVKAYGSKLKGLSDQLAEYEFSAVRAAIVASVPSRVRVSDSSCQKWGHLALRDVLQDVSVKKSSPKASRRHLVSQVSSIASLPANWPDETIHRAARTANQSITSSIVYPTQQDLQNALRGYATGGSIHTKIDSAVQQKQVTTLRPQLHRWAGRSTDTSHHAGRHLIPPHIKTYICYSEKPSSTSPAPTIDWALLTSANLSKQAWGTITTRPKGVKEDDEAISHISSFEIGVLVWPELFDAKFMVPTFGKDTPELQAETVVGFRMPYDLPLTPYTAQEMPWSPSRKYTEPDRLGQLWQ